MRGQIRPFPTQQRASYGCATLPTACSSTAQSFHILSPADAILLRLNQGSALRAAQLHKLHALCACL
jgi:hypothetical protein